MQPPKPNLVRSVLAIVSGFLVFSDSAFGQGLIQKHWVCNAYGSKHDHPDDCADPAQGGQWVYGSGGGSGGSNTAAANISAFQQRLNQIANDYRRRIRQQMADDIARDNKRIATAGSAAQARLQSAGNAVLDELAALDAADDQAVPNQPLTTWSINEATKAGLLEEYGSLQGELVASLDQLAGNLQVDESMLPPDQLPSDGSWFTDPTAWPPDAAPPADADLIPPDVQTSLLSVEEVAFLENRERMKDRDGDGFQDEMTDAEASRLGQQMRDRDGDGFADELTDDQARIVAQQMKDRDGDGLADELTDGQANVVAEQMKDRDGDGLADEMTDNQAEVAAQQMKDRNGDGLADELTDSQAEVAAQQMKDRTGDGLADELTDSQAAVAAERMKDRDGDGRADELTDTQAGIAAQQMKDRNGDGLADELTDGQAEVAAERMKDRDDDGRADELTDTQAGIVAQQMKDRDGDGFADERTDAQARRDAMKQQLEGFAPRGEETEPSAASPSLSFEESEMTSNPNSTSPINRSSEPKDDPVENVVTSETGLSFPAMQTPAATAVSPPSTRAVGADAAVAMDDALTPAAESAINRIADERFYRDNPDLKGQALSPGTMPQKTAEWLGIRDEVAAESRLNSRVDQIFRERRPDFDGRRIDPVAQPEAAQEWLSIRDQLLSEEKAQIPVPRDSQVAANTSRTTSDSPMPNAPSFAPGPNAVVSPSSFSASTSTGSNAAILRAVPVAAPGPTDIAADESSGMAKPASVPTTVAQNRPQPFPSASRTSSTPSSGSPLPAPVAPTDFWSDTEKVVSSGRRVIDAAGVASDTAATYARYDQKASLGVKIGKQITLRSAYREKTLEFTDQARARGLQGSALMADVNDRLARDQDLKRLHAQANKQASWAEQKWFAIKATTLNRMDYLKNYAAGLARNAAIEEASKSVNAAAEEIGVENESFANTHMMTRYTYNFYRGLRNPLDLEASRNMADALWTRLVQAIEEGLREYPDMDPELRKVFESFAQ